MELTYPWVIYIGILVLVVLSIIRVNRKSVFKEGKKVANTDFVEQTDLYKKLKLQYKIFGTAALVCLLLAIAFGFVFLKQVQYSRGKQA